MEVRIASLILRFATPLQTAYGELHERELLLLRLRGSDGVVAVAGSFYAQTEELATATTPKKRKTKTSPRPS